MSPKDALPIPFGPYVLSSLGGARPISDFSGAKAKLDGLIAAERKPALTPWVVHDLRRSTATHMARLGIAPHHIEVCLGHTPKGIAERTAIIPICRRRQPPFSSGRTSLLEDQLRRWRCRLSQASRKL